MKKYIALLLILALTFSLFACGSESDDSNRNKGSLSKTTSDRDPFASSPNEIDPVEETVTVYFPAFAKSEIAFDLVTIYGTSYTYDENWNRTEVVAHREVVDREDREETARYTYVYDANGNMTEEVCYRGGEETGRVVYSYDTNHNKTEEIHYSNGEESGRCTYAYDANGNMTEEVYYLGGDEEEYSRSTYTYDARGNVTEEVYSDGDLNFHHYTSTYVYDIYGNITESVFYVDGEKNTLCTYIYDTNGNLLENSRYYYAYEYEESCRCTYSYDADGNLSEVTEYYHGDKDGATHFAFTFDKNEESLTIIMRYENEEKHIDHEETCRFAAVELSKEEAERMIAKGDAYTREMLNQWLLESFTD